MAIDGTETHADLTTSFKGWDELIIRFDGLNAEVRKEVPAILAAAADIAKQGIVDEAPEDTGFMREHIDVRFGKSTNDSMSVYIGPNGKALYPRRGTKWAAGMKAISVAVWLEFGHRVRQGTLFVGKGKKRHERKKGWTYGSVGRNPFVTRAGERAKKPMQDKVEAGLKAIFDRVRS